SAGQDQAQQDQRRLLRLDEHLIWPAAGWTDGRAETPPVCFWSKLPASAFFSGITMGGPAMQRLVFLSALTAMAITAGLAMAAEKTIQINAITVTGVGESIGSITAKDSPQGLVLMPKLSKLSPVGPHGFHMHEKPDCGPGSNPAADNQPAAGMAAG